jgi:hypothetical protein
LVNAEPSLFSVGGSQSRVATPFVVVVFTGAVLLLLEATVVVVPEVVPEAGVVIVGAAALEAVPDEELVLDATIAPADAAPVFATVAVVAVVSIPCERSIMPTFGDTRLALESEAVESEVVEAAAALLDPDSPPPQAARVSVASVHRTMLRI